MGFWFMLCRFVSVGLVFFLANIDAGNEDAVLRDLSFTASCDETAQNYVVILPPHFKAADTHDVLIALHGHGADRWQFAKETRDEARAARDAAARHRMIFVSPDYRARTSWMGPKAESDVVQIIGLVRKEFRVGRVFLCGASMGGTSSLTFAVLHPELISGVAAMNGMANHLEFSSFQDAITASFGGNKASIPLEYKSRSAEYWPERLTMPVGLTVGGKDTIVPPQSVKRLANILENMKRDVLLICRDDGGHSTTYDDATRILEFVIGSRTIATSSSPALN